MNIEKKTSVLFVCTGNICRSPAAEAVFRRIIQEKQLDHKYKYDSAGTHGYHVGDPPDARSIAVAEGRGTSMQGLFARKLEPSDFKNFDFILAMDKGHLAHMTGMGRNSKSVLSLLLDHACGHEGMDVPDPYYGSIRDFEEAYDLIEKGVKCFTDMLLKKV